MHILVLSDIHLEFGPFNPPDTTDVDVVVAAGDIDVGTEPIAWLAELGKPVIYVAGNHEYWGGDIVENTRALRQACRGTNIRFLEQNQLTIDGVTFYGCTLWTDFLDGDAETLEYAREMMNDFVYVSAEGRALEPEVLARYNRQSVQWLGKALGRTNANRRVVVTHHAPSLKSWGFDPDDLLRYAYCNELDEWIRRRSIDLWIHGHVHCRSDYRILDTRVVCNPRGYTPHRLVEAFEPEKIVKI